MTEMNAGQENSELAKLKQIQALVAELISAQEAEMGGGEAAPAGGASLQEKLSAAAGSEQE